MTRAPTKRQALDVLRKHGVPINTVLDVGILTGTPELIEIFPDIEHVLFEPIVEFNEAIHAAYSGLNYELVSSAVNDVSGLTLIETHSIFKDVKISHSQMVDFGSGDNIRRMPMVSLDDYLQDKPKTSPYLLKIDVDGAEMKILDGAKEVLKNTSVVIIETPRHQFIERVNKLFNSGFTLFDLSDHNYYDGAFWQCDAIFIRNDVFNKHFKELSNSEFEPALYEAFQG